MLLAEGDPAFAPFLRALEPVSAAAAAAPGFRWQLDSEYGADPDLAAFEDEGWLVNMSLWDSLAHLRAFLGHAGHQALMRRRREWFERPTPHLVLWWLPDHELPTFSDAMARLETLGEVGPSAQAFTFQFPFSAADSAL